MQNRNLFFVLIGAALILGACSSGNDVMSERGIQKRKYRKGFYVAHPAKPKTTRNEATANAAAPADVVQAVENPQHTAEATAQAVKQAAVPVNTTVESVTTPATTATAASAASETPVTEKRAERVERKHPRIHRRDVHTALSLDASEQQADDTELLLYILLSILLPPLAVYLLYGISTNFWISVVLTILFWVPGVIFALIHVINRKG